MVGSIVQEEQDKCNRLLLFTLFLFKYLVQKIKINISFFSFSAALQGSTISKDFP